MAFADFLAPLTGATGAVFFAGAFAAAFVAVFAGALAADFLTGTEFFFAAADLATGLAGAFLAAFAGAAFFAVTFFAETFLAGVFLAGAAFFGATYASFSANLQFLTNSSNDSCNNKSPCQARSSTRATSRGCSLSVLPIGDTAESRSLESDLVN
jgi:hypothetical protein